MSKARKLKTCPFCGAEVKTEPLYDTRGVITAIYCTNETKCGAMVTFVGNESKKKALAAWDNRTTLFNKDFKSLNPEEFERTAAGLLELSLLVAPIIIRNDYEGRGVEDAAQFALDLQIGSDAVKEIAEQVYGQGTVGNG